MRRAVQLLPVAFLWSAVWPADFEKAQQVLVARCTKCHGAGGAPMAGLDLTRRAGVLRRGELLVRRAAEGSMPPGEKLDAAEVTILREWIAAGAPWGDREQIGVRPRAGLDWWSLQPIRKPPVPAMKGAVHPIDAFLLAKLREKGLDFSPEADPRTLERRLSFDLLGLPPGAVPSGGYPETVERMLASPHYGERWARHWLDAVRFGETDGGEHNNERMTAWKYRDYVIHALNAGVPYDQFIREQIAGDVLAPSDPMKVAATGFLVAGPWDSVTAKLNKDKNMQAVARMDELDDMISATFATFQGLTVNCARCHDHKFDPIPTRDYYRIAAVFNGAGFGERIVATPAQKAEREKMVAPIRKELDSVQKQIADIEDVPRALLALEKYQAADTARAPGTRRIPVNAAWNRITFPPVTARYFRFVVTSHIGKRARIDRLELLPARHSAAAWTSETEASPDAPAILRIGLAQPAEVSEIVWSSDRERAAREGSVKVYRFEYSADGAAWKELCSSLDHVSASEHPLPVVSDAELDARLSPAGRDRRERLQAERKSIQARLDAVPPLDSMHAVVPLQLTKAYVLERGSLQRRGEEISPGALSSIRPAGSELRHDEARGEGSRRLALADWIANPSNPLTARVIVNRIWYLHFGNGLVNTPNDFGFNGDRPSHPALLDWLAAGFMENGWNLKWLHRQIVSTRAYRQSSVMNAKAHAIDAGNRLLWRMPLRRMDAEMLRDAILFAADNLDLTRVGGKSFALQKKGDRGSYIYAALPNDGPEVWRRAVYRFVVRGGDRIFMDSFDCPDPSVATPQRSVSNTPIQALTLLNNEFVLKQSGHLARRLEREAPGARRAQIDRAYTLLFGRKASAKEHEIAREYLAREPLAMFCRALFNSNEFVYVP